MNSTKKAAAKKAAAPKESLAKTAQAIKGNDPMNEDTLNGFRQRIGLLEQVNVDLLKTALGAAGVDWGAKRRQAEVEVVERVLVEVEGKQAEAWEARRTRVFGALAALELDDDARHQFISDATSGATTSTKTLTEEQANLIIEAAGADVEQQTLGAAS